MSRPAVALRAWWWLGGPVLLGLAVIGLTGHLLIGGVVMTAGFVAALVVRLTRPSDRAGGLPVRSRNLDAYFYGAAAVNVLGAVLLVTAHADWRLLLAVDAGFFLLMVSEWWRSGRARSVAAAA